MKRFLLIKLFFPLLILFSFVNTHSQEIFRPGRVILLNDTLVGNITVSDNFVKYREFPEAVTKTFKPEDVIKAEVEKYVFKPLRIIDNKPIFVLVGVEGSASVYERVGQADESLILKLPSNNFVFLSRDEKNEKYFKKVLSANFQDCEKCLSQIEKANYAFSDLSEVVYKYNTSVADSVSFFYKKDRYSFEYSVIVGNSFSKNRFDGDNEPYLTKGKFIDNFSPVGGLAIEIKDKKFQGASFYNEVLVKKNSFEDQVNYYYTAYNVFNNYSYDILYLRINTMFRFYMSEVNLKPYFAIGMTNSFALKVNQLHKETYVVSGSEVYTEKDVFNSTKLTEHGIIVGFGASYKQFQLQTAVEMNTGIVNQSGLTSVFKEVYLTLGYRF